MANKYSLNLTAGDARNIAEHIELTLIDTIRVDTTIDNIDWIRSMMHVMDEARKIYKEHKNEAEHEVSEY